MWRRRPRLGTVIAGLALFVALGGTAAAARHYLVTSTSQIKPGVLRALKGKAGRAGIQGPQGSQGVPGPQGPAGPSALSALVTVIGPSVEVPSGEVGGAQAVCPAGYRAIGGGGSGSISGIDVSEMESTHLSWFVITANETGITVPIHAEVQCAGAGQAVAARAPHITHPLFNRRIDEVRSELLSSK
jgi:hypothetical protein